MKTGQRRIYITPDMPKILAYLDLVRETEEKGNRVQVSTVVAHALVAYHRTGVIPAFAQVSMERCEKALREYDPNSRQAISIRYQRYSSQPVFEWLDTESADILREVISTGIGVSDEEYCSSYSKLRLDELAMSKIPASSPVLKTAEPVAEPVKATEIPESRPAAAVPERRETSARVRTYTAEPAEKELLDLKQMRAREEEQRKKKAEDRRKAFLAALEGGYSEKN